ncbi:hypothetical protein DFQ29_007281 [Apophysomyces sp. BC1021]|nr:hypothetical protein DFQ29_007281 [Apophysomyces sp. BC1021]
MDSDEYETADELSHSSDEALPVENYSDDESLGGMDKEVAAELLEWRRQSLLKIDWSNLFCTKTELWRGSELFEDFQEFVDRNRGGCEQAKEKNRFAAFDFTGWSLDNAFRELSSKIWIARKVHALDTILLAFACRYYECNPRGHLKDQDSVLVVIQLLVLLDIELHVNQSVRMTSTMFCEHTMRKLCDAHALDSDDDASGGRQEQMKNYLQELYYSVKQRSLFSVLLSREYGVDGAKWSGQAEGVSGSTSFPSGDTVSQRRRSSWTKLRQRYREKQGPYREGPLAFRKVDDDWQACWVILDRGYLLIYVHSTGGPSHLNRRVEIHLGHTLAQVDDEGRPHVFLLKLANGQYFFDCGSERQVHLWIDQCNYWAALESKLPCPTDSWPPPMPSAGASFLKEKEQYEAIRRYIAWLDEEYDRHFENLSQHQQHQLQAEQQRFLCYIECIQRNRKQIEVIME